MLSAFHSSRYIGGLTHEFYRYPAATSPELVRELLLSHTGVDDVVLDPWAPMGWYRILARAAFFTLPPEAAHRLAYRLLGLSLPWERLSGVVADPALRTSLAGIELANPVGLAACGGSRSRAARCHFSCRTARSAPVRGSGPRSLVSRQG